MPVQTIVPLGDKYVAALSENLSRWVPQYYRREVAAGHWLPLADPTRFAALAGQLIDAVESGNEPPALANARRRATSGRFSGKVAVVTGAGSGIAARHSRSPAKARRSSRATSIRERRTHRAADRLTGAQAHAKRVDVGSADDMEALATWVGSELGGADVVINNAGIGMAGGILDTSTRHWERILHVNLWGVIHGSRLFAQQMAARGTGGHIVNTASAAAFGPSRDLPAYATTKAAVLMLSECMRAELAEQGIGVTAVCPGFAETGIMASTQYAGANAQDEARLRKRATKLYQMRGLKPETVAQAMVDGVLRNPRRRGRRRGARDALRRPLHAVARPDDRPRQHGIELTAHDAAQGDQMTDTADYHKIKARHVKFDFSDTPVTWVPNDPGSTHIINTLNLLFPEGELWFCRVYNKALPLITDARLRDEAEGFLRQEAVHSRSHGGVLKHYYDRHGIDTKPFTQKLNRLFTRVLGEQPLGLKIGHTRFWLRQQLAVIASLEHFFGYLGNWVLNAHG